MDERLCDLAAKVELIHTPFADVKEFPEVVDITLVEGAVGSEEELKGRTSNLTGARFGASRNHIQLTGRRNLSLRRIRPCYAA